MFGALNTVGCLVSVASCSVAYAALSKFLSGYVMPENVTLNL